MKRTLVMIRHAKSSWANPLQSDFERPLNDRGLADAPVMGKRLANAGLKPDLVVSSTALRTRQTSKLITAEVGYSTDNVQWEEKLYHCVPAVFDEVIMEAPDDVKTLFIVAHNPGITDFVNQLSPDFSIGNMPTCGMVGVHLDAQSWADFYSVKRKVFMFDYPKNDHDD
jgi:phosphohistidine phosphatase